MKYWYELKWFKYENRVCMRQTKQPNSVGNYTLIHYYIKNILQCCDWLIKMKYLQIVMKSPNLAGTGYYSAKKTTTHEHLDFIYV